MKIDLEKFICSLMQFIPVSNEVKYIINIALKDQGLEYKDGAIVEKIKPKFKVGDWVVYCNADVDLITNVEKNGYRINNGGYIPFTCASDVRLWTIQDARKGDVLAASDGSIFLFAGVVDCACKYYVALPADDVIVFDERLEHYWETSRAVHPASKEQRDLLFQKMKEAGYKWNAEELKLEKIEELSEFEKAVHDRIKDYDIEIYSNEQILEYSKVVAKELLELARKELEKQK